MSDDEDDIKQLMYQAFERAFQEQLAQLYKVYISNALSASEQAKANAKRGVDNAVAAYRLAISSVDAWGGGDERN